MTRSKQSSVIPCSFVISTLTRRVDTGSQWCTLNARTKNIFKKLDLTRKNIFSSINQAGYRRLRMYSGNMESLIFSKFAAFWKIWKRCLLQTLSSSKFERSWIYGYYNTKINFFDQVTLCTQVFCKGRPMHW